MGHFERYGMQCMYILLHFWGFAVLQSCNFDAITPTFKWVDLESMQNKRV
jgi:hypothetical protein